MEISGYHGGSLTAAYVGLCLTNDETAAENYASQNGEDCRVYELVIAAGLTIADVEYDYDGCEPILTDVTADVVEYLDCDEQGRTHRTWMLLTPAAVAATTIL